jgi:DNA-binding FadR family transcriptional regulator
MECIMTTNPTKQPGSLPFDPQRVAALRQVLDIAVEQIAVQHRTPATKAMMAQIIVRHAADGITDASALVSHAVRAGADGAP